MNTPTQLAVLPLVAALALAGCAGLPDQRLANEALKRGDTALAQQNYRQLADLGYSEAQVGLADIQVESRDPAQIKQAEATYRAAADTSPRAQAPGPVAGGQARGQRRRTARSRGPVEEGLRQRRRQHPDPLAMLYLQYPHSFPNVDAQRQIGNGAPPATPGRAGPGPAVSHPGHLRPAPG